MEKTENGTRREMLANEKVGRLLYKLSIPSIIAMMVQALYNIVDTIFVGKGVGMLGIGGIAIGFPMHMLVIAIAQTVGVGGASRISRRMGAGDMDGAALTYGNMVILAEIIGFIILIVSMVFMEPLLRFFGATEEILPYSVAYFRIIFLVTPILTFAFISNDAVRAEGNAKVAMATMLMGSILNIILDPIFIFGLNMGIRGAAIATVISMTSTGIFLVLYLVSGRSEIPVGIRYIRFRLNIAREILAVGSSSFAMAGAMSFTMALVNNTLRALGGSVEIATLGIIHRMFSIIFMPVMGLTHGMQPVVGFNFGAGQYDRVKQGIKLAGIASVLISSTGFLIMMIFPQFIMGLFSKEPELLEVGKNALRYCILGLPLAGLQMIGGAIFQALGKSVHALILTLSRQVLILIPLVIVLPRFIGLNGVWISFPAADSLSFILTLAFVLWTLRALPDSPGMKKQTILTSVSRKPATMILQENAGKS
jgi:putative MATE family efflux protein